MKKSNCVPRGTELLLVATCILLISGCRVNYQTVEFRRAEEAVETKDYVKALRHYDRAVRSRPRTELAIEAARRGSRLAHLETTEFMTAIEFYRHLILHAPDPSERVEAQKKIASIYFEKISDYAGAIREYSNLLALPHSTEEEKDFRFNIAKSYFYLNNFYQAATEIKDLLKVLRPEDNRFEYLAFRGNILLTTKRHDEAAAVFEDLIKSYPEEAMRENVQLSLAVTFEEKGDYNRAIAVLEGVKKIHPSPEFIELRINRIRERIANQPGAGGFAK